MCFTWSPIFVLGTPHLISTTSASSSGSLQSYLCTSSTCPPFGDLAISAHLHCDTSCCPDCSSGGSTSLGSFLFSWSVFTCSPSVGLCTTRCLTFIKARSLQCPCCSSSSVQSSFVNFHVFTNFWSVYNRMLLTFVIAKVTKSLMSFFARASFALLCPPSSPSQTLICPRHINGCAVSIWCNCSGPSSC